VGIKPHDLGLEGRIRLSHGVAGIRKRSRRQTAPASPIIFMSGHAAAVSA
jgi:hypothetical protein